MRPPAGGRQAVDACQLRSSVARSPCPSQPAEEHSSRAVCCRLCSCAAAPRWLRRRRLMLRSGALAHCFVCSRFTYSRTHSCRLALQPPECVASLSFVAQQHRRVPARRWEPPPLAAQQLEPDDAAKGAQEQVAGRLRHAHSRASGRSSSSSGRGRSPAAAGTSRGQEAADGGGYGGGRGPRGGPAGGEAQAGGRGAAQRREAGVQMGGAHEKRWPVS